MVVAFDRITITVADLATACNELKVLTGKEARILPGTTASGRVAWLALSNTTLELVETGDAESAISALVLAVDAAVDLNNSMGVSLSATDGKATEQFRADFPDSSTDAIGVDHVVLRCNDGQDCIDLFGTQPDLFHQFPLPGLLWRFLVLNPSLGKRQLIVFHAHCVFTNKNNRVRVRHRYDHHCAGGVAAQAFIPGLDTIGKLQIDLLNVEQARPGD